MEEQINDKMTEIIYKVNDMIPVEWDDLYINFEDLTPPISCVVRVFSITHRRQSANYPISAIHE